MSQSNLIAFWVFVAFVIFITMKGKLPKYIGYIY